MIGVCRVLVCNVGVVFVEPRAFESRHMTTNGIIAKPTAQRILRAKIIIRNLIIGPNIGRIAM